MGVVADTGVIPALGTFSSAGDAWLVADRLDSEENASHSSFNAISGGTTIENESRKLAT
jgi:hypothetical protein